MERKLAVIMSLYKNDMLETVSKAVESVLNQTYHNFDFYIQFDGPIDAQVAQYVKSIKDNRLKLNIRNDNKGLAFSLNELLNIVIPLGYPYIARMDADDICLINRFERQLAYFEEHPEVECLGTWAIEINDKEEEYYRKQMPESHEECRHMFRIRDCMIHPTVMFRKSFFDKAGLYSVDTYFGEDTMMWAQGFKNGCKFANVPEYLFKFRLDVNFFERRRGWKHAKSIYILRHKVNKMLNYGISADLWALVYAVAKMMPKSILNLIYKTMR